jgi:putative transcriptional regulator
MTTNLTGKILIAMPSMMDSTFGESVVFLCAHSAEGAMGLIINKPMPDLNFMELADQIDLKKITPSRRDELLQTPLLMGGPVEQHRGFVLHSADYRMEDQSLEVTPEIRLSATTRILQAIAQGNGPQQTVLALGYAGWSPGQLENEILHNGWLHADADADLVFSADWSAKHKRAMAKIGIDPGMLSSAAGHG